MQGSTVLPFDDQGGANLALSSGRADVVMADSPVNAYAAQQSKGAFMIVGTIYGTAPYGIAIPKKSTAAARCCCRRAHQDDRRRLVQDAAEQVGRPGRRGHEAKVNGGAAS